MYIDYKFIYSCLSQASFCELCKYMFIECSISRIITRKGNNFVVLKTLPNFFKNDLFVLYEMFY